MTAPRLSEATLGRLPSGIERPGYDRGQVKAGVIHLGLGAFHRAHQAVVFEDLLTAGDRRWGVRGASLRSPAVRDQLAPQDGLYSVVVRDGQEERVRVVGAVRDVLVAPEDPAALLGALASPDAHLVTLTITEKGYKLDPATGTLITADEDVAADLSSLQAPRTAPGFLAAAMALRRERGLPGLTAISCDNMPENGRRLRAAVLALARARDEGLEDWIERRCAFPQTMVDRIVPATTGADVDALTGRLGLHDAAMVKTEPFTQWVVEGSFAGARPELEAAGVNVTDRVEPWETAKLRLLNGAHSAIAYLGGLAAIEFVHEFVARPGVARFIERLWDEAQSTLEPPRGLDLAAYRAALTVRFANPALRHRTRQIAMDGSQKLPQRLLAPVAVRLRRGQPITALALAVAAWMRWQEGRDEQGTPFQVDDPLAHEARRRVEAEASVAGKVEALLNLASVFPPELAADRRLRDALVDQGERLRRQGALAAAEALGDTVGARGREGAPARPAGS